MTARPTDDGHGRDGDAMHLGFGCVNLGSASHGRSWRDDVRLVQEAIESGVRHFDTADVYTGGRSERVLGRAVRGRRDDVIIATKAGYVFRPRSAAEQSARRLTKRVLRAARRSSDLRSPARRGSGSYRTQDFSPAAIRSAVDASLRRLGTDRIDVFQLHGPHRVRPELLKDLDDLISSGKVLRFGIGAEGVEDVAGWLDVYGVELIQLPFGVLDPDPATATLPEASERGIEVWAHGVLGGGLLRAVEADLPGARSAPKWPLVERLIALADRRGIGLDRLAVGFVRSFPQISTFLVGISSSAHLRRNLELAAVRPLDDDVVAEICAVVGGGSA